MKREHGEDVRSTYARHVNPTFTKLLGVLGYGRVWARAEGTRMFDREGRGYVDLLAGFGALNLGHGHPAIVRALSEALAAHPVHVGHAGLTPHEAHAAERLVRAAGAPFEIALMSSSGAEAVEAAIKLARAATRRAGILYCRGGFHGLSLGTLSIMGAPRLRSPFEPLLPDTDAIDFGDLDAARTCLATRSYAAFVVEPIQAEAGIVLPPDGYLAGIRELCTRHGTQLVFDEVQTGLGRCGSMFAFQAAGVVPDLLVLAKSLGGGIVPVGATLASTELHRKAYGALDRFDAHGSTFAGNALACAAVLATLDVLEREQLAERSARQGDHLRERLVARIGAHPLVRGIRGRGLLVGVELGTTATTVVRELADRLSAFAASLGRLAPPPFLGQWVAVRMLEAGFVCQPASHHWDVLKLEPPLTIAQADLDAAVDALAAILDDYSSALGVLRDVGTRMTARGMRGFHW